MSILCNPNINEIIIAKYDFIAMIDNNSCLKIYGNTNHELAKLLMNIASTFVIFIVEYDKACFDDENMDRIVLLLSNNEIYFVTINNDKTYIVNKIIPKTKWISKLKLSRNRLYGRNEHDKIEIIYSDILRFANRDASENFDNELLHEHDVCCIELIRTILNNCYQPCGENYCIVHTDNTLTFNGQKLQVLNDALKHVNCKQIILYEHTDEIINTNQYAIHMYLLTIDKQFIHYKLTDNLTIVQTISNVNYMNVNSDRQILIRENDVSLCFANNDMSAQPLPRILTCALRCYSSINTVKMFSTLRAKNKEIELIIFEDGFVLAISQLSYDIFDCIHITDKTRPFATSILL